VTYTTGIIAVTEDPYIRKFLGDVLKRRGYRVVGADSARAIEMIRSGDEPVDLVITNTPVEFASVAEEVPVLYIAAAPDPEVGSRFRAFRALRKPFLPDQLIAAVKELAGAL
jgi:DNA-binding response OmpR family regulator